MIPNQLQKGDVIGVVAPSSPILEEDLQAINQAILLMEKAGYRICFGKYAFSNTTGYGATPKEKAKDLKQMFLNSEIKMIWCAKGGANSNAIFEYLDYEVVQQNPKIICGFSDSTSLLNRIYQETGLVTFHGATFKSLVTWQTDYAYREAMKRLEKGSLEIGEQEDVYKIIHPGEAEGILIGGNLSLISRMVAGKYALDFHNKILFLEETGWESDPEMISGVLAFMKQNGIFNEIVGLWIGNYEHKSGITLEQLILDTMGKDISIPIIKSNNFGHTDKKTVIPIGALAKIIGEEPKTGCYLKEKVVTSPKEEK